MQKTYVYAKFDRNSMNIQENCFLVQNLAADLGFSTIAIEETCNIARISMEPIAIG